MAFVLDAGTFFPSHIEVGGGPGEEGSEVTEAGVPFDGLCCLDDGKVRKAEACVSPSVIRV